VRILVTGGAGYIGSHAARALARRGHEVIIYDNLSTGHRFLADGFPLVVGDTGDGAALAKALGGVDAVMHFAAFSLVGESVRDPRKYFENNVRSGLRLLNAVLDAGVRHFVFSSTAAVYGEPEEMPITEACSPRPSNPYGTSKLAFEHALEGYRMAYGLGYASLRYFNAAGADASGEIGELHQPETHLIPSALLVAAGIRPELEVFGDDYPTPDGTCIRDYIHVTDLAEAHVLALDHLQRTDESLVLNLGTGHGYSVKQVITAVEEVTGLELRKRVVARRAGDPPVLVADGSRARATLRWQPPRSLQEIVSSAWTFLQRHLQQERPAGYAPGAVPSVRSQRVRNPDG
jgi:UDP-glucose 4-epimerase